MVKMTATEARTAKMLIDNRIDRINNGMLAGSGHMPSMRDHMAFSAAGWNIDRDCYYITKDGENVYRIHLQRTRSHNVSKRYRLEYLG